VLCALSLSLLCAGCNGKAIELISFYKWIGLPPRTTVAKEIIVALPLPIFLGSYKHFLIVVKNDIYLSVYLRFHFNFWHF